MAVGALIAVAAAPADAAFKVRLTNNAATTTVADNSGGDNAAATGAIAFGGSVGAYNLNLETAFSKPIVGDTGKIGSLNITSNDIAFSAIPNVADRLLVIEVTDTGYTIPNPPPTAFLQSFFTSSVTTGFTASLQTFISYNNTEFDENTLSPNVFTTGLQGPFPSNVNSDTATKTFNPVPSGPFSITIRLTLTSNGSAGGGQVTGRALVSNPEPATLLPALLAGLPLLALARSRFARRSAS